METNKITPRIILKNLPEDEKKKLLAGSIGLGAIITAYGFYDMFISKAKFNTEEVRINDEVLNDFIDNSAADLVVEEVPADLVVEVDVKFAGDLSDHILFEDAFAEARGSMGKDAFFEWDGSTYSTYYKEEWDALTQVEQDSFYDALDVSDAYLEVEPVVVDDSTIGLSTIEPVVGTGEEAISPEPYVNMKEDILPIPRVNEELESLVSLDMDELEVGIDVPEMTIELAPELIIKEETVDLESLGFEDEIFTEADRSELLPSSDDHVDHLGNDILFADNDVLDFSDDLFGTTTELPPSSPLYIESKFAGNFAETDLGSSNDDGIIEGLDSSGGGLE